MKECYYPVIIEYVSTNDVYLTNVTFEHVFPKLGDVGRVQPVLHHPVSVFTIS